jgi:fructose-bisphosphate aldolase class II
MICANPVGDSQRHIRGIQPMALVNIKDLLRHAYHNRYAVGAFEVVSLDFLRAIIQAAEEARSPVILNIVETHEALYDTEMLMAAVMYTAKCATVPVAVSMDHCTSLESVQNAIRLGCNSVMFDAADESFPVNTRRSAEAVELSHKCGVPVEGEVGHVAGNGLDLSQTTESTSTYTTPDEARAYVERTGVDFLAISVGTVHGRNKGKSRLDFTRLARINETLQIPLVIHGGSGLSDDQYQKLIARGVARINYFTALAEAAVQQTKNNLKPESVSYQQLVGNVDKTIAAEAQRCMQVWGSAGRAAEVLIQCRPWHQVEQMMTFKPGDTSEPEVMDYLLSRSKQELEAIPGVMQVQIGKSLNPQGQLSYCLQLRLASEQVVSEYKKHPGYIAFEDKYARHLVSSGPAGEFHIIDPPPPASGTPILNEPVSAQPTVVEFKTH